MIINMILESCIHLFLINRLVGQLLDVLPKHFMLVKSFNSAFSYIEVWFSDQNSKPLEPEDKINILVFKKNFMAPFYGWVQLPQG